MKDTKTLISYMLVFVLGFGACALILNRMGYLPQPDSGSGTALMQTLTGQPSSPVIKPGENPLADAVAAVGPAVVSIDTVGERSIRFSPFGGLFGSPQVFTQPVEGQGSGVVISSDGHILTNNHVVEGARQISVRLADGKEFKANVMSRHRSADLAVLKVNARNLPAAKLGDSDALRVGDWAIAIGNPLGFGNTVTVGVISATKRTNLPVGVSQRGEQQVIAEAIQTDAAINRGNSGGALVNIKGEVIGINTAIFSTSPGQGNIGIGFAIPSNYAKEALTRLLEGGSYPYLGVTVADLQGDLATWYKQNGYEGKGAVVWQVDPRSPAGKAGITQGDVITQIDDAKIDKAEDLTKAIRARKVGQTVRVSIWRGGQTQLIAAKLGETPRDVD